ncbi:hypothetical protein HY346_00270 [Candidatus Microgenomates bacterium]|nr:hypothetical protein [Candidatus Microgenomates bacterium]
MSVLHLLDDPSLPHPEIVEVHLVSDEVLNATLEASLHFMVQYGPLLEVLSAMGGEILSSMLQRRDGLQDMAAMAENLRYMLPQYMREVN